MSLQIKLLKYNHLLNFQKKLVIDIKIKILFESWIYLNILYFVTEKRYLLLKYK